MDSVAAPHPRGSLFDDDVSPQDEAIKADAMGQSRGGGFLASGSVEPRPQRVVSLSPPTACLSRRVGACMCPYTLTGYWLVVYFVFYASK